MDELLNTEQVAKRCGLSEMTVRKWRMTGEGPRFIRLGRAVRYRLNDLEAFLAGRAFSTTTEADFATLKSGRA
jgi:predicted DNA-binding transcriptional regulator AlpA